MKLLDKCKDYKMLKESLNYETLEKIDKVLIHFEDYEFENDNGKKDIIGEYYNKFGNGFVIDWYEGLMSTEDFIQEINFGYEISEV